MGVITDGAVLINEVKGWPPLVNIGSGLDLVTQNQWWDDVGTPTTKATAVPVSGEAGLSANFTDVIKCVTDAVDEGFKQRYTYSEEPRVKSGKTISAAIWVGSVAGGVDCTVKLVNSDASETIGVLVDTIGDWDLYLVEAHVCAGTYVELQVTKDTAGTFYAGGNITVMIGEDAIELPPRPLVDVWIDNPPTIKTLTGVADEDTWTDIDNTANSHPLAAVAYCRVDIFEDTEAFSLYVRRNGNSQGKGGNNKIAAAFGGVNEMVNDFQVILDDGQIFEYLLDRTAGVSTLALCEIYLPGYKVWA